MTLATYFGPHLSLQQWDINLLAVGSRRWYGEHAYLDTYGGGLDVTRYLNSRTAIVGGLNIYQRDYAQIKYQNGLGGDVSLRIFYTPTTASVLQVEAAYGWQKAAVSAYSNKTQEFSLSYSREFRGGFTVGVSPSFTRIAYERPLAAFNRTRTDEQYNARFTLLNRRIDIKGFTPRIIYTFTRNASNIPLYTFTRNRFEFGITTSF